MEKKLQKHILEQENLRVRKMLMLQRDGIESYIERLKRFEKRLDEIVRKAQVRGERKLADLQRAEVSFRISLLENEVRHIKRDIYFFSD